MEDFIWFTKTSWSYMKGNRIEFFTNFIPSWFRYRKSMRED